MLKEKLYLKKQYSAELKFAHLLGLLSLKSDNFNV